MHHPVRQAWPACHDGSMSAPAKRARVALIGFEPQVFFLSERGFAGGLAFYDLGWNSSDEDQALVIERWSRQQVPVVLAMDSEWGSFSRDYPAIRGWIDTHYDVVAAVGVRRWQAAHRPCGQVAAARANAFADGSALFQVTISSTMPQHVERPARAGHDDEEH